MLDRIKLGITIVLYIIIWAMIVMAWKVSLLLQKIGLKRFLRTVGKKEEANG